MNAGFQGYLLIALKTPHCGFRVAGRRPEVSICQKTEWSSEGYLSRTYSDNNYTFRYGYCNANTVARHSQWVCIRLKCLITVLYQYVYEPRQSKNVPSF